METEKLYYADAYQRTFSARVVFCEHVKGQYRIALDRTAFYPEGGGQPADHGTLRVVEPAASDGVPAERDAVPAENETPDSAADVVSVTDVHERDGVILHTCSAPLPVGAEVSGELDWPRRFDHMQQHSGEHIISGLLCGRFHCDNVGFHLGAETVTIDYNALFSYEQALEVEREANAVIWRNAPTEIQYPSREELDRLAYRSKKALEGQVRIVAFPGADCCACCGTHVRRAGEVGLIKILSCQKFREGVRLEIVCGARALRTLSAAWEQNRAVGQRLSVKPLNTAAAVERLEGELDALKERAAALEEAVFDGIARDHVGRGDVLLFREIMRPDSVRRLADAVAGRCGGLAAVFAGDDGAGWNYALVHAAGTVDVKPMNAALHGRGGGRGGFAQGSVHASRQEIEAYFSENRPAKD